jgi:hypothetical protein
MNPALKYALSEKGRESRRRFRNFERGKEISRAAYSRWATRNREKLNAIDAERAKRRYLTDGDYRLRLSLRRRLLLALKKSQKTGSAVRDLGCSISEFKAYIEAQWQPGMSWDNLGKVWQLDHIKALAFFDLSDRAQLLVAVHYTNQQPLFTAAHREKSTQDLRLLQWLKRRSIFS